MNYLPVSDNTARQVIDATTVWTEYLKAYASARPYAGGMYWKKEGAYEYLVKTYGRNRQERVGSRSDKTERIYQEFHRHKSERESRLSSLTRALTETQRQNKALKAGRTPDIVVRLLNAIREAGLEEHFIVVGTHALYAYEAAAGVRIVPGALATQDVDLLWDARKRVQFLHDLGRDAKSMLTLLKRVDASFRRKTEAGQNESAVNGSGFEVDFLRREVEGGVLFVHPVISATGKMATMRTVAPQTFVEFKSWMAAHAQNREASKRRRDLYQSNIVQQLITEGLLPAM